MAKKSQSRDQKRKATLAKRKRRAPRSISLAYTGNKYRTADLASVFLTTESGIRIADVASEYTLTDRNVEAALETLILQLRDGPLPALNSLAPFREPVDLIIDSIRQGWESHFSTEPHPGRDCLVGVLRTLLGSIEVWTSPGPKSRDYLKYNEKFLAKCGVSVVSDPGYSEAFDDNYSNKTG